MKILCPKCQRPVPSDQINVATDLAFCPRCSDGFKISQSIDQDSVNSDIFRNPPKGSWFRKERDRVIVGASTRSPWAFIIVPFMCVWSGGSIGGIYGSQIAKGEFNLESSLFGIPFLLGSIIFGALALMTICGKVEISIGKVSSVFVGIGKVGWTRRFDWASIHTVREEMSLVSYPGGHQGAILMEGKTRLKFGTGLNEKRRYFFLNALKYLKMERG